MFLFKVTTFLLSSFLLTTTNSFQLSCKYCTCGQPGYDGRIVGGEDAPRGKYRWHAALKIDNFGEFCGGSLISQEWVVTAGHCVEGIDASILKITLGSFYRFEVDPTEITYGVSQIIRHENFDLRTIDNDIALIKLNGSVPLYNYNIAPICLPFALQEPRCGDNLTTIGTGVLSYGGELPDKLQEVVVPYISTGECQSKLYDYGEIITENMFCAGLVGKDACQGDSGSALMASVGDIYYILYGIVSFGFECARERAPGVYTKVANYLNWIVEKTGTDFCTLYEIPHF